MSDNRVDNDQSAIFETFENCLKDQGQFAALEQLASHFTERQQYHHLFEVLKMQARISLGLPITFNRPIDSLPADQRQQFDELLLEACLQVGKRFWSVGRVSEGWTYLQPYPDRDLIRRLFDEIEVGDDNLEEMIAVAISESIDPARGFQMVLDRFGTCNAITTYDSNAYQLEPKHREELAASLVNHFYQELSRNLAEVVQRQSGVRPAESRVSELMRDREWLFSGGAYHIDTTHLASIVRIGRIISNKKTIERIVELCCYGLSLDPGLQFEGDAPFFEFYQDHLHFYRALLGEQIEQATAHFEQRFSTMSIEDIGSQPYWEFVNWYAQIGLEGQAMDLIERERLLKYGNVDWPLVVQLAETANRTEQLAALCKAEMDVLGFAISRLPHATAP